MKDVVAKAAFPAHDNLITLLPVAAVGTQGDDCPASSGQYDDP